MATYNDVAKAVLALRLAEPLETDAETRWSPSGCSRIPISAAPPLAVSAWRFPRPRIPGPPPRTGKEIPRASVSKALAKAEAERNDAERKAIDEHFHGRLRLLDSAALPEIAAVAKLELDSARLDASVERTLVSEATEPTETRILPRGNWMDDSGAVVEPAIPAFLGKLAAPAAARATRLDLANWLVSPDNPLTARVFVNRLWRQFFGIGHFQIAGRFRLAGRMAHASRAARLAGLRIHAARNSMPTERRWDMRHMVRAHRHQPAPTGNRRCPRPELEERDPDNRLLARQSRFRVDAENVRDIALSVSGLLVEKFGGPSVKPYQPDGYLAALNFPKREYSASHGDDLYRRGVYTFWQRTFLHPSLLTFDAPTREECTINRTNSNTPLQALVLLNDPIYVEAARVFAENMLRQGAPSTRASTGPSSAR